MEGLVVAAGLAFGTAWEAVWETSRTGQGRARQSHGIHSRHRVEPGPLDVYSWASTDGLNIEEEADVEVHRKFILESDACSHYLGN